MPARLAGPDRPSGVENMCPCRGPGRRSNPPSRAAGGSTPSPFPAPENPRSTPGSTAIIRGIKTMTDIPVVVLTNSSIARDARPAGDLLGADIVVPSLDAATDGLQEDQPPGIGSAWAGRSLPAWSRSAETYQGQIWLEIMLVKGVNDSPPISERIKEAVARIRPDKIQLNTVVRPPAEKSARPLGSASSKKSALSSAPMPKSSPISGKKSGGRIPSTSRMPSWPWSDAGRSRPDISPSLSGAPGGDRRTPGRLLDEGRSRRSSTKDTATLKTDDAPTPVENERASHFSLIMIKFSLTRKYPF